jgi:hypothetical protein
MHFLFMLNRHLCSWTGFTFFSLHCFCQPVQSVENTLSGHSAGGLHNITLSLPFFVQELHKVKIVSCTDHTLSCFLLLHEQYHQGCGSVFLIYRSGPSLSKTYLLQIQFLRFRMPHFRQKKYKYYFSFVTLALSYTAKDNVL